MNIVWRKMILATSWDSKGYTSDYWTSQLPGLFLGSITVMIERLSLTFTASGKCEIQGEKFLK